MEPLGEAGRRTRVALSEVRACVVLEASTRSAQRALEAQQQRRDILLTTLSEAGRTADSRPYHRMSNSGREGCDPRDSRQPGRARTGPACPLPHAPRATSARRSTAPLDLPA